MQIFLLIPLQRHDPDILVGYDPEALSWGYLSQRAAVLDVDLPTEMSRIPEPSRQTGLCLNLAGILTCLI